MNVTNKKPKYYLNAQGEFVIENYNYSKPFSNFFPGIAGKYGIPMWTFYVNRAQGISSFGIKNKDHAILEFFPANKAWEFVSTHGFRTFLKVTSNKRTIFYEPFHNGFSNLEFNLSNKMLISPWGLSLEELNLSLGLKVRVEYFNIPNDNFGALARNLTIENTAKSTKTIELIDGFPQIVPYGTNNFCLKEMSRTIEAWMNTENLENNAPFYRLTVDPTDRPEVVHIDEGNFYLGFTRDDDRVKLAKPIANPEYVFGPVTDFSCPSNFLKKNKFVFPANGTARSKTPCAFSYLNFKLKSSKHKTLYSLSGYMRSLKALNKAIPRITAIGYFEKKQAENRQVIEELTANATTHSSSREFDLYSKQTYLDNLLRGGFPLTFDSGTTFYLYSRKHGDPERDYNKFQLSPTYLSQGNGNYRDLNQNRRSDIWFNPEIKDENVLSLFNLIQLDGFNPLVVKGMSFVLKDTSLIKDSFKDVLSEKDLEKIIAYTRKSFCPGDLILFLEDSNVKLKCTYDEFLNTLLSASTKFNEAEHGEGFWTDHWHYNLDLLNSYLSVYPDKLNEVVFEKNTFTFFDNIEVVKPRAEKYLLYNGIPRQLHAVTLDSKKKELLHKRHESSHIVRTEYGVGKVYETTLINKLLCLLANKFASLDAFGVGIEMESDKPNWFDSLNGLPALFGSSLCETFELKRLALFIKDALQKTGKSSVLVTEEVQALLSCLDQLTLEYFDGAINDYAWWDKTHSAKEDYRLKVRLGVSGDELEVASSEIIKIIDAILKKINPSILKACNEKDNLYCGYFINKVIDYQKAGEHFIKPTKFEQVKLPLFLEPQVHALRLMETQDSAKLLYQGIKKSRLFDKKLMMYKVTEALETMPEEIGRCRIFSPGWLENESVWLHMEYKYLLELLKAGLYEEFYTDFKLVLVPFLNPQRYGRSILENTSFIVSSAFSNSKLHGNGFVARLSGSTAEFLEIWLTMNVGTKPFSLDRNGNLNLKFSPKLAGWLFDKKGNYGFNFLSKIKITYHNPKRKNTFGSNAAQIEKIIFQNEENLVEITAEIIPAPYAQKIRSRQINKIDIYLK
ncbi:MAG: cellobiose phosphorylase [Candidatus Omnitrophica bacterium]|nr:cellobiose phosphorylase [Candidatus Omnitrophota bacterium]